MIWFMACNVSAAIHQCANGEFRDTPCPNGRSEVVNIDTENAVSTPPADKIDFSGDDNQKLGRAIAELESMKVDAVDCKIGLKVKGYSESCPAFVRYFGENGHLSQSVDMLRSLANKGNFYGENKYEMDRGLGIAQEIINTKYFYDARNK